jgi:hypothetical protein
MLIKNLQVFLKEKTKVMSEGICKAVSMLTCPLGARRPDTRLIVHADAYTHVRKHARTV